MPKKGGKHKEESIQKIRKGIIGFRHTQESIDKMRKAATGRTHTEEAKIKIGLAQAGKIVSEETKAKQARSMKGRTPAETTRQSCSEYRKQQVEFKNHMSKAADIYDYETNELIAENIVINYWATPLGYSPGLLYATATGRRNHHKGIYARYTGEEKNDSTNRNYID